MMTGWLIALSWFLAFIFLIWKVKFFLPAKIPFLLAAIVFTIKCAGAIFIGWLYTFYYKGGDTFVLFNDSNVLFDALKSQPADYFKMLFGIDSGSPHLKEMYFSKMMAWYNNEYDLLFNDARTVIRIHSIVRIFSFGEYYVHAIFFSFFSFTGLSALYRVFSPAIKKHHELFYAVVFLVPSLAFWGSGALKEAIVLLSLGLLIHSSSRLAVKGSFINFLVLLLSAFLLVLTRFYFLIALVPGLTALLLSANGKNTWQKFAGTHLVWFLALYCYGFVNPSCDVPCIMAAKQNNFVNLAVFSESRSIITEKKLEPQWSDIIIKSPAAFITTLTQPLSFSSSQLMLRFASLETLFILLMLIEAIILFRIPVKEDISILLFCVSFTAITFTFLGLTTPVAGTLVRYKIIALPFLAFAAGYFISNSKLFKKDPVQVFKI